MSLGSIKVLAIFGTRPEFLKMYPVIDELKNRSNFDLKVINTAQHRNMLDDLIEKFPVNIDFDLDIMTPNQTLSATVYKTIEKMSLLLSEQSPDWVLVQGDTNTAMSAALTSFYTKVKVAHIEAGLRSFNMKEPYPEEANRVIISNIADLNFAPTDLAKENLIKSNVENKKIKVVGNTIVDQLHKVLKKELKFENNQLESIDFESKKVITVTAHRRENHGKPLDNIISAIHDLAHEYKDLFFVYPVHPNPNVKVPVHQKLSGISNIMLLEPINYIDMVNLMSKSYLLLSDSGGVQEEAPALKKPVLIMRDTTERPEVIECGCGKLVGTKKDSIINSVKELLDPKEYKKVHSVNNPFGDGTASIQIADALVQEMEL